jgi:hypothetical protein
MRRTISNAAALGVAAATLAWAALAAQSRGAYGNADAITEEELRTFVYFLASDQMEGRNAPSRGFDIAALYVASHLREWGLRPGGSATGTDGPLQPYLMPIELVSHQFDGAGMRLSVTLPPVADRAGRGGPGGVPPGPGSSPAAPRSFEYGREWTVGAGGGVGGRGGSPATPAEISNARMVFVGNGYVVTKAHVNPYEGLDVRGKVLVVAGLPPELAAARAASGPSGGRARVTAPNPLGVENVDFLTPQGYAAKNGAVGVLMVPTFQQLAAMSAGAPGQRGAGPNGPPFQVVQFQTARPPAVPVITAGVDLTTALFQGERLSGAQVFDGAAASIRLDSFELAPEKTLSLHLAVTSEPGHTENVVAMVEGGDPRLRNEFVLLTAHLDHVGLGLPDATGDTVFNGADDDGSGSAALMAIAHAFADGAARGVRPRRTVVFLWAAGEEKGLWGSQYFVQFPPIDIKKVVVDLNMDMIGRTKTPGYVDPPQYRLVDPGEVFVVGPHISSTDLEKSLETLNAAYQKLRLDDFYDVTAPDATHDNLGPSPNGQRIFYRSDHYNFAKMGIPVAFFCDGLHVDYHRLTDSPEKLDYRSMLAITKTVAALAWVMGSVVAPPRLNAKLPDQLVSDMRAAEAAGWGKRTPVLSPLPGMPF